MNLLIDTYEDELARLAKSAQEIKVLIAFLTEAGLRWLPEDKAHNAEFIVGTDLGITTPEALRQLQRQGAEVRVYQEPGRMFHPKAIYLRSASEETLIIGSNNLTARGISSNHEISVLIHRNALSESVFGDFLGHFRALKVHACCRIPDDRFFMAYRPTPIQDDLARQLHSQVPLPLQRHTGSLSEFGTLRITSLGDYLSLLAREFPKLDRSGVRRFKDHPLYVRHKGEFHPFFKDIVSRISNGRMTGESSLVVYGNWRKIPFIVARDAEREPWANTGNRGVLKVQIHFTDDFTCVFFSMVLTYSVAASAKGAMPPAVAQRHQKLLAHIQHAPETAQLDGKPFMTWIYKGTPLWGKPLLTFAYQVDKLPDDESLCTDLEFLVNVVNGATAIS